MSFSPRRIAVLAGALFVLVLVPVASADTYRVNDTADSGGDCVTLGTTTCTLRAALTAADLPCGCGFDVIEIAPGTYDVDTPLPIVTQTVAINGTAGAASTIIDGHDVASLLDLEGGPLTEVAGVTLQNARSTLSGAGLYLANGGTLHDSVVRDDTADGVEGGGISADGPLTVQDSTIAGNHASAGAGIWITDDVHIVRTSLTGNVVDDPSGAGGGIADCGCLGTTETIDSSLIAGNSAAYGGGVALSGGATIINSTLASNDAPTSPGRGAAALGRGGNIALVSSTVAGNRGTSALFGVGSVTNSIIGPQSFGPSCDSSVPPPAPLGQNIDSGHTCSGGPAPHWLSDTDPQLQSLADNGGPTRTMALTTGSLAVDAADGSLCPAFDQRHVSRTASACDIGAFEGSLDAASPAGPSEVSVPAAVPPAAVPPAPSPPDQAPSITPFPTSPAPTSFVTAVGRIARDGSVVVALNAPGAGTVTVSFTKGVKGSGARAAKLTRVTLATGKATAKSAGPIRILVRPNAAGKRALKGRRALYVLLTATQGKTTATRTVLLTKPRS